LLMGIIGFFLCRFSKSEGFVLLNSFHTKSLNIFFQNITFLGDGIFILFVSFIILVFFKKHRKLAFLLLLAYLVSGVFAQIFKSLISSPRPSVYFEMHHYKYYLDTFANSRVGFRSFPSGHSASAFAMATIFSIYANRKYVCIFSLVFGLLVGYSRIYLAHHFLIDVLGGIFIGIVSGSLSVIWYDAVRLKIIKIFKKNSFAPNPWANAFSNSSLINR
jgi:membrane-associated phospholipid phosphatase